MTNLLDRVIGYVSPKAGATRAAHRRRMELLDGTRSYEAASGGRLAANWNARATTADAEIGRAGQTLRDRSRDLIRNHPLAAKIVNSHVGRFVGFGITPRVNTGDPTKDKLVMDLFNEWSKTCIAGMNLDLSGGQTLLARMMAGDGEVYVRRRNRLATDGFAVPLQLQILDAEYCDWAKNGKVEGHPQNVLIQGVEFDAIGNRRGYWLHPQNPRSALSWMGSTARSSFVPVSDVVHLYEPQANQVHGVPWLSPVMTEIKDLKDYELAENIRKKVESCMVGMVVPGDDDVDENDPNMGIDEPIRPKEVSVTDMHGFPFERMEPGMFGILRGGKDIKFNSPAISAGVEAYIRTRQRSIAAGARLPYEIMTGDFSQANFASGKLGLIEYQIFVEMVQWQILIPGLNTIWGWFIDAAKLAGLIPVNLRCPVEWSPPETESITRLDDARADLIEMRIGKRSPQDVIARTGRDPALVLKEIDEWNTAVDQTASKVVLDSDPRKVTSQGQAQWVEGSNGGGNAETE